MTYRLTMTAALMAAAASACNCSSTASMTAAAREPSGEAPESDESPAAADPSVELPDVPPADPRERFITMGVARLLQGQHLAARSIDDEVSRRAFEYYLERLDPAKLFLLQPHVQVLRKSAGALDDQLLAGELELARLGGAIVSEQRKKVAAMVAELTSKPFDLTREESFETDADKRDYAPDNEALQDLWRKNLKRQVLERMARMRRASEARAEDETAKDAKGAGPDDEAPDGEDAEAPPLEELPETDAGREAKARKELAAAYAGRFERRKTPKPLEAVETFVNAVAAVFGPHTHFLAPDDKANFDIQMTGSLEGIGAVLSEGDHYIEVQEVVPGGAAWRQGELEAGDLILSVQQEEGDPVDVADMRLSEVVQMIRGPKGTVVTLSVRKPDGRLTSIVITRDVVVVEATYARGAVLDLGKKHPPVGYVYLPGFYGNTRRNPGSTPERNATDDVRAILQKLDKRGIDSVVLDVRGNGGGLLSHATGITGLFIEKGPVVQVRRSSGEAQVLKDEDPEITFDGKLLVLVDRFSASGSEILAGALQDYERALVVGTGPTHGKGTVQVLVDFDRLLRHSGGSLGVLKLTTQQFFLVDGESTQQRGVRPDVVLPDPASFVESGERYLDNPIPWSKVAPLPHEDWSASWDVERLSAASDARQRDSKLFATIQARGEYLQKRQDQTRVPLQQRAWQARQDAEEKKLKELDPKLDEQPARFSVEQVSYRPAPKSKDNERAQTAAAERMARWRDQLARDPWLAESLHLVHEMDLGKVEESKSRKVEESKSRKVERSKSRKVERSKSRKVEESKGRRVE